MGLSAARLCKCQYHHGLPAGGASDFRFYQRIYLRGAVRFLSVILFNYFLTEPRLSLAAYGSKYPVTFAVMFTAALLTGTLAAKLKAHAQLSARDAYRTKLLLI